MGIFSQYAKKVQDAKVSGGRGVDLNAGSYLLKVDECKAIETVNKGTAFEVWFTVLEARQTEPGIDPNPVGSKANQFCLLSDSVGLSNAKATACALSGFDAASATDAEHIAEHESVTDMMDIGVAGAFNGKTVFCDVVTTPVKNIKPGGRTTYPRRKYLPSAEQRAIALQSMKETRDEAAEKTKAKK